MKEIIESELLKTYQVIRRLSADSLLQDMLSKVGEICSNALSRGNKVMFVGNGGSAADSQHLAAELVSRLKFDRPGLYAIALTTDTSALTAIGNDYGFDVLFSRQVEAIGKTGDILFCISTSGNSVNILKAAIAAKNQNILTIGFTGKNGGKLGSICDYTFHMPSNETAKIQEGHIVMGHILCALIEEQLFGEQYNPSRKKNRF